MKAGGFALAAVSLLQLAVAQPHRHGRRHHLRHDIHAKRDVGSVMTDVLTVTASEVVVWVDESGSFVSVETKGVESTIAAPPQTTAASTSSATLSEPLSTALSSEPTNGSSASESSPPTTEAPIATPPSDTPASSSTPSPASSGAGSGSMVGAGTGACYTPYNDDGTCKDQDAISKDFEVLSSYPLIRIYGVDCNQVSNVLSVARQHGKQVMLGIIKIDSLNSDIGSMVQQVNSDWSAVYAVNVGNEVVNNGGNPADVVNAIRTAKTLLKSAGFSGPVVTVDTQNAILANPSICQESDFPAANIHAFFNKNLGGADQAGAWVASQAQAVSDACGGKTTLVTESGWPTQGTCGSNCPNEVSVDAQSRALNSLRSSFSENLLYFSGGSTLWKAKDPGPWGVEAYWAMENP